MRHVPPNTHGTLLRESQPSSVEIDLSLLPLLPHRPPCPRPPSLPPPQEPYRLSLHVVPRPYDPDSPDGPTWSSPPPAPPSPPPHRLQHWFGVRDFVVLAPATLSGRLLHADDVSPLSSALYTALAGAGAPWPGFVPVADPIRDAWFGASTPADPAAPGSAPVLTRFEADGATGTVVSRKVASFGNLADLFQERLEGSLPGRYEACSTAAFAASAAVQRFFVLPQPPPEEAASSGTSSRRGGSGTGGGGNGGGNGGRGADAIAERLANWKLERSRNRDDDFGIILSDWCARGHCCSRPAHHGLSRSQSVKPVMKRQTTLRRLPHAPPQGRRLPLGTLGGVRRALPGSAARRWVAQPAAALA